ncbi:50S ribosomal protein L10 [Candidatus Blochmanniella vafra]|nr:50S ribosomal protein L10 [Candidatus Blochmannia vafer]
MKKKEEIVYRIKENFKSALSVVVASLHGVTACIMNELRKESRDLGVYIKVVPNSLLKKAVVDTSFECLSKVFVGSNVVAFSTKHPRDAGHILVKFFKERECFKIAGAAFEGNFIGSEQIDLLSNLPDHKDSLLRLILILRRISIGNLINILKRLSSQKKLKS